MSRKERHKRMYRCIHMYMCVNMHTIKVETLEATCTSIVASVPGLPRTLYVRVLICRGGNNAVYKNMEGLG